jgi:cytochrome P450 family 110
MSHPPIVRAPRLQQLLHWSARPLDYLDRCADRYGDCFIGRIGTKTIYFFSHPDAIAQIFAAQSQTFDVGRIQQSLRLTMGDSSTLVTDGEPHRQRRKLVMPPFHGERMRAYGNTITEITRKTTASWQSGQSLEMLQQTQEITLQIMLETVFGLAEGDRYDQIKQELGVFLNVAAGGFMYFLGEIFSFWVNPTNPAYKHDRVQQQLARLNNLIFAEIRDRRSQVAPTRNDILSLLLSAQDEAGNHLSDQELRDELITLLVAGHDSSAATLAWALYHVCTTPSVHQKLISELDQAGDTDPMTLVRLPYLSAVCSESLRLRSAAPTILQRITNQPIVIQGHRLPEDTLLVPCNYLTHHRSDLYPNPKQFRPERFLERQYSASEYYPFGGGDRYCIGAAFALFEMKLVLAHIIRRYDLLIDQLVPIDAVRRGINISPQGGVRMTVQARSLLKAVAPIEIAR